MNKNIQVTGPRAKRHNSGGEKISSDSFHMPNPVSEEEVERILAERAKEKEELEE